MNTIGPIFLIILFLAFLILPASPATAFESDEAVAEAFGKATGKQISKEDICIERPESFKDVVVVGFFAHDRGCMPAGYFVGGAWIEQRDAAAKVALSGAGWATADEETRKKLATDWFMDVIYAFDGSPVESKTSAFGVAGVSFEAPSTTAKDGVITVSAWIREPSGMVWEESYFKYTATFSSDLTVGGQSSDAFSVPGEMLKD
jgi:hypothetical protein